MIDDLQLCSQRPPMNASKWLHVQLLLDGDEMARFLEALGKPLFAFVGMVRKREEIFFDSDLFLERYCRYIAWLRDGKEGDSSSFLPYFNAIISGVPMPLCRIDLEAGRVIAKAAAPVIQMQAHNIGFSAEEKKFRAMIIGTSSVSISWGIQFSYPLLYENSSTHEIFEVKEEPDNLNTHLFHTLQKWVRRNSIPTPFVVGGDNINVPMRLGKGCLPWINSHPDLLRLRFEVCTA